MALNKNLIEYENTPVKVVALRKISKVDTPGLNLVDVDERKEFTLPYWIAKIFVESGLVRLIDEGINNDEWTQVHFKERFNPTGPLSVLPNGFYSRAYVSLNLASENVEDNRAKQEQLNRIQARYRDVLESRIGKLVRVAAAEASSTPKNLETEEVRLFEVLESFIKRWREDMRKLGAE
ncbi:hypothetical protein JW865_02485 [Candidatus Bathyarchaeota archaeon]|nr:hypothetical protein [Candidatus Bathyarchaeota archaeon]